MKRICALFLFCSLFLFASCNAFTKVPQYMNDIVGEWKLSRIETTYDDSFNEVDKLVEIKAFFKEDYTGMFIREETEKSWSFTWSYDKESKSYLIYRANDEYVRFSRISDNDGVSIMYFHDFVGTKVK